MAADFNKPTVSGEYLSVPGEIRQNFTAVAQMFQVAGSQNIPDGAFRVTSGESVQQYSSGEADWTNKGAIVSRKNRIINGAMAFAQRGTSFASPSSGTYTLDRWVPVFSGAMATTITQDSSVPTQSSLGTTIEDSLKVDVTTADASIAAGDYMYIDQRVEGSDFRDLYQNTFTLSFQVRSTTTGTYCVSFSNSGLDRTYVAEYTISAADTWEAKEIVVSETPSGGTWDFDDGIGLRVRFCLAAGSTYQTTAGAWQSGNYFGTSSQTNLLASTSNDIQITAVKLEKGDKGTPFLQESFTEELERCQRFCQKSYDLGTALGTVTGVGSYVKRTGTSTTASLSIPIRFPTRMRTAPTLTAYSYTTGTSGKVVMNAGDISPSTSNAGQSGIELLGTDAGGSSFVGAHFIADAEL